MGEIRVLLVDDCIPVRGLLRQLLGQQQDMQVVAEVGGAHEAMKETKELAPDVVLMDVSFSGRGALQATQTIRTNLPQTKAIWLTSFNDEQYSSGGQSWSEWLYCQDQPRL